MQGSACWTSTIGCPIASRCELKLEDGSVYSQPSPTQLDKIKNLHSQIRSGPVVGFSSHPVSDEACHERGWEGIDFPPGPVLRGLSNRP